MTLARAELSRFPESLYDGTRAQHMGWGAREG